MPSQYRTHRPALPGIPLVLAGPILRRLTGERLTLWLACSDTVELALELLPDEGAAQRYGPEQLATACRQVQAGEHLYFILIDLVLDQPLPKDCWIGYDLTLRTAADQPWQGWQQWGADIGYPGKQSPGFVLRSRLDRLLHGSCRKPHYHSQQDADRGSVLDEGDGMNRADEYLGAHLHQPNDWPTTLLLTGDQIYADDVAGPMLAAIHRLIKVLKIFPEPFAQLQVAGLDEVIALYQDQPHYYQRDKLLPDTRAKGELRELLFSGVRKPVFTSDNARNHLITLAEMLSMYLLSWSPVCWGLTSLARPAQLTAQQVHLYEQERPIIEAFVGSLSGVRRVMAHLPCAMIFDDHDVTDDWNLTAAWEKTAYGHPFSRRIIGNALTAYLLCQGWGNAPENFPATLLDLAEQAVSGCQPSAFEQFHQALFEFRHWHFFWDTEPVLLVLDTRTRRWRSEQGAHKPSGLMDWEAITDLQHALDGHPAVVMVSAAPVFGVKLIEAIQRIFTWAGHPLMVDAENWMAHPGAAYALMNLFHHPRTPQHFVILSGDVHYSFMYDVKLRARHNGPDVWQITSSGVRNEFPRRLLDTFDRLNRWLYAPWSPLNWLTKRRDLRITPRKPEPSSHGERLVNDAGIGLVELDETGRPRKVQQLCADGRTIDFTLDRHSMNKHSG